MRNWSYTSSIVDVREFILPLRPSRYSWGVSWGIPPPHTLSVVTSCWQVVMVTLTANAHGISIQYPNRLSFKM